VPPGTFLDKSALDLEANDLIWEFFRKHPMQTEGRTAATAR
jgi:hypothetical protein